MELQINGQKAVAQPGQTLLEIIRSLGMDSDRLSERPVAAQIAGEVFNLNYVPVREKDINQDRPSIRRAMAASQGKVKLLYYRDPAGKDVYSRTVQFVLFLALRQLWPQARAKMNCTVGPALFIEVMGAEGFSHAESPQTVSINTTAYTSFSRSRFRSAGFNPQTWKKRVISSGLAFHAMLPQSISTRSRSSSSAVAQTPPVQATCTRGSPSQTA